MLLVENSYFFLLPERHQTISITNNAAAIRIRIEIDGPLSMDGSTEKDSSPFGLFELFIYPEIVCSVGINSRFPNAFGAASDFRCFAFAGTTGISLVLKPEDKSCYPCHNLQFPGTDPIGRKQPVYRKSALS